MVQLAREKLARLDDARALLRQLYRSAVDLIPDQANKTLTVSNEFKPVEGDWNLNGSNLGDLADWLKQDKAEQEAERRCRAEIIWPEPIAKPKREEVAFIGTEAPGSHHPTALTCPSSNAIKRERPKAGAGHAGETGQRAVPAGLMHGRPMRNYHPTAT
jgi:hypothetical protein